MKPRPRSSSALDGTVALLDRAWHETGVMSLSSASAFAGFRFPREVISVAVRWYLRYGLSYRDVEELLAERGVTVDHVTVHRGSSGSHRSSSRRPGLDVMCRVIADSSTRPTSRSTEAGRTCIGRSTSKGRSSTSGLSARRDLTAARTFFTRALATGVVPVEVTTDRAPTYPRVLDELAQTAMHNNTERYANNRVEADHGRLKARLRPMRGLKTFRPARILATGHALSKTCDAATSTSPPTSQPTVGCRRPSMNSRSPPDRRQRGSTLPPDRPTQQSRAIRSVAVHPLRASICHVSLLSSAAR